MEEFPQWKHAMSKVVAALRQAQDEHPSLRDLVQLLGPEPARKPPPEEDVQAARARVCQALGIPPEAGEQHHTHSVWRHAIVAAVQRTAGDPDTAVATWLREGAPAGFSLEVPPGPWFPEATPSGPSPRRT